MMLDKFFNRKSQTITAAAMVIAGASLVSRLLGVLRDRILAGEFGAGDTLDMYYAAFKIPDAVFNLLVMGAISAGFIPVFIKQIKQFHPNLAVKSTIEKIVGENNTELDSESPAWRFVNIVTNLWGAGLIIGCGLLAVFTQELMPLIAPGFSGEKMETTIMMTRLMFASPLILGLSAIWGGVLQSFKKFFIYSIAPIVYNIGIMAGAVFLVPVFGIYGLAYGVILGAIAHFIIQYPAVIACGYRPRWIFDWRDKAVREVFKLMIPRTIGIAVSQFNILVITAIASTLASGSIAIFNFANNLQSFPVGIFAMSLAVAALPALAESAAQNDREKLVSNFSATCRQILFWLVPSSILFLVLRAQIVRSTLGSGLFDWEDTITTADALAFFSISLFAQGIIPLLVRLFYALRDTRTPFFIGAVSAILNIILSLYAAPRWGVVGLAASFSLSSIFNLLILWVAMKIKIGYLDEVNILKSLVKIMLAAFTLGLSAQLFKYLAVEILPNNTFVGIFFQGLSAGVVGIIFFVLSGWLLGSEELMVLLSSIKRKFWREAAAPVEKIEN